MKEYHHYRPNSYIPLTVINFTNKAKVGTKIGEKINKMKLFLLNMTQLLKAFITQQSH